MAPSPQEPVIADEAPMDHPMSSSLTGEEVVISGMSGIFPKSGSTTEFMDNLYNKVDMVEKHERWDFNHPEVPKHLGMVKGMEKFDAQFFRVHYKQACTMEPMSRKLLEHAYSAIYDSGMNPLQLQGRKVGVFIGSTFSESEKLVIYETIQRNGFGITGCNKAMYANRISYWIDGKGPSYTLDMACSSSMACVEHAYRCISTGQCDAAIVGGCNLCMHPNVSLNMKRAGFLCLDGKTKSFDKSGDGYVRSDAISVLFLQKAKDAKRIYSEVFYAKGQYSSEPSREWLPIRQTKDIQEFLEQFYSDINVSPSQVEYVEAHGAGIAQGDSNELKAIGKVFAKNKPVKVGSVKSNMGHSEPASGACALTKVCLAYHKGQLPANLHFTESLDNVSAVRDGRVEVVQEAVPFNRGFSALSSFSYTGANIHVLLKGRFKPKDSERYKSSIPHLVLISGRQDSCVRNILDTLVKQPIDPEQIGLLHSIYESDVPGHLCRGYTILQTNEQKETTSISQKLEYYSGVTGPIWFVYSGMGSQWAGMGNDLMRIPIFASAIQRCHKVLEPKGIDIIRILTEPDKKIYDNILNSFVGIAAVQIGLTDILRELQIVPDNIIGHSVGELGCAYADGCFTAEEMILSAYSRGLVSVQTPFIRGSMAAVGLGYKAVLDLCPPEIEVACHNSHESSTISGPADIMKEFVTELTNKGIFAKEVPCSNIAYHSRYIADAGPCLRKYLSEVIKDPKPRSKKWVSTSVPQEKWDEPVAKYSSAEYHTNNLLNSVLFEETAKLIPENAIVIEIAPHGLLQAIVKRSHPECTHVPLTRRGHAKPVQLLLESIGKLYQEGLNPKIENLYPKIQFPVSTETPLLSHFVEWVHTEDWPQAQYNTKARVASISRDFVMSIHDDDYKFLEGNVRGGVIVFPEAALLVLVWETLAMYNGCHYGDLSVSFRDVLFHTEARVKTEVPFRLGIMILKGNNVFEVSHDGVKIVTGRIYEHKIPEPLPTIDSISDDEVVLTSDDVYKIMHLRGYSYKNQFQSIMSTNIKRDIGNIKWTNEWVPFLDALIQFNTFARDYNGISVPKLIKKLSINTSNHLNDTMCLNENEPYVRAHIDDVLDTTRCGGVQITNIVFNDQPIIDQELDILETGSFIPHFILGDVDMETALLINMQIIADNVTKSKINITEIVTDSNAMSGAIKDAAKKISTVEFNVNTIKASTVASNGKEIINNTDVFVVHNLLENETTKSNLGNVLSKNAFVLTLENHSMKIDQKYKLFNLVSAMTVQRNKIILLGTAHNNECKKVTYIPINHDGKFSWVPQVQKELQNDQRIVLVSERQPFCGLLGLVKKLNKDYENRVGLVIVDDYDAPPFNPKNNFYKDQLQKNLIINILKKGLWGGKYYLPTPKSANIQNFHLITEVPGDIDSLTWSESPTDLEAKTTVQVSYAGPSFRDALKAVGKVKSEDSGFGMDFSGFNKKGEKVMGIIPSGAIASTVEVDPDMLWPVPEHWSLEDAATVPLPYLHAYYCLAMKFPLISGRAVFINGGAGALGQAVISICLELNCTVYTIVSDIQKKQFLLKMFPKLDENNIGCSRDDYFYNKIITNTKGKRCSYVINCLSGPMRKSAMKCVGLSGVFFDISDYDMRKNEDFNMNFLDGEKNYISLNLANLFNPAHATDKKRLHLLIAEGIAKGIVKPISRVIYSPNDITKAFRLLSSSKQRGRVLIRMRDPVTLSQGLKVKPRMTYSSNHTYVVVICDDNYLGIELVDHLVTNGARKLIIHMKTKLIGGYFLTKLISWRKLDAFVQVSSEDIQTETGCANLLEDGTKLGAVQGIFIVQNTKMQGSESLEQEIFISKFDETALVVANLDFTSRKLCKELRHFVSISGTSDSLADEYAVSVSRTICQSRTEVGLPALAFHVTLLDGNQNIDDVQWNVRAQKIRTVFNSLEISLKLKYDDVISFNFKQQTGGNVSQKIARVLGMKSLEDVPENLTLKDVGLNEVNVEEVQTILKTLEIDYSDENIHNMTIASVKELKNNESQNSSCVNGLDAFYTFIDEDECMATEHMIPMPTKLSNATEKEEEMDPKADYLMLIPGFEGHHQIFSTVCERVKIQAMALQLGPDILDKNIQEIAVDILKFMKKRFYLKSKFYFLGYSFGVNIALELAALMEKEGYVGVVYCLDSSPDALRTQLDAYVGNLTDSELQNSIIEHMYRLMAGRDSAELKNDLKKFDNWSDKIEACVTRLRGIVNYSNQYKRSIIKSAYDRIKLARDYEPDFKLESEVVLMKGIPHPKADDLTEDYNLSKYAKHPVKVFNLESEHPSTPYDCRVSNIVNRLLDPKILEEFKKQNLCETYLSDPVKAW